MKSLYILIVILTSTSIFSQNTGINTTEPKTTLHIEGSPNSNTALDGVIVPRLTGDQLRTKTYTTDQTGALVYVSNADSNPSGQTVNVNAIGYYYYDGSLWQALGLQNNGSAGNMYTSDGSIPANTTRVVSLTDDTSQIKFERAGNNSNQAELINVLGNIKTTGVDLNSDARLKTQIKDLDAHNSFLQLRPVSYFWNEMGKSKGGNDKLQYGFIAQDLETVFPHIVNTDSEGYKSVNYIQIVPIITKQLQVELDKNAQLEQRVIQLEKQVTELINNNK